MRAGNLQNGLLLFQRYQTDGAFRNFKDNVPHMISSAEAMLQDGLMKPGRYLLMLMDRNWPGTPEIEAALAPAETWGQSNNPQ